VQPLVFIILFAKGRRRAPHSLTFELKRLYKIGQQAIEFIVY